MTKLAFVDTETTGLHADRHQIWEVGLIVREADGTEHEHCWQLPVSLSRADPNALAVGRFHERHVQGHGDNDAKPFPPNQLGIFAREFARFTHGTHLVGAVVSFDEERLRRLLERHGEIAGWHYHLVTVEALAAGWLHAQARGLYREYQLRQLDPNLNDVQKAEGCLARESRIREASLPWTSERLSRAVGVDPPGPDERHTGLGDARWAKAIYDAVMGT